MNAGEVGSNARKSEISLATNSGPLSDLICSGVPCCLNSELSTLMEVRKSFKARDVGAGWAYKYGARIMKAGGAWGTTNGHGLINGNTFFDEPASLSPPPYFPSIPSFALKSYEENFVDDGETI